MVVVVGLGILIAGRQYLKIRSSQKPYVPSFYDTPKLAKK